MKIDDAFKILVKKMKSNVNKAKAFYEDEDVLFDMEQKYSYSDWKYVLKTIALSDI